MKLILEGDKKKVQQVMNELKPRCKRDKIYMSVIDEEIKDVKIEAKINPKKVK